MSRLRIAAVGGLATLALVVAACGGRSEGPSGEPGSPGNQSGGQDFVRETVVVGGGPQSVRPTAAPAATAAPQRPPSAGEGGRPSENNSLELAVAAQAQERIIVRTANMDITAPNVATTIEAISRLAVASGGWVVSASQAGVTSGSVSIRVPATGLDTAIAQIRTIATRVRSERSTSQDFTEEFTDTTSRVQNLQATEATLRALLDKAATVEDAIKVQSELTKITGEIERLQGRLTFLGQSAAFSLISVNVEALPSDLAVDAGPDITVGVGERVELRASFPDLAGFETYQATWDFGDGTTMQAAVATLLRPDGTRVTAPVSKIFYDDQATSYVAKVTVKAFGPDGIAEGSDTVNVAVSRIPAIEIFMPSTHRVEQGERVDLTASFTRPANVSRLEYTWEFGDGSQPEKGEVASGATTLETSHSYANFRSAPYQVVLTLKGESSAGIAESKATAGVTVTEPKGWTAGRWAPLEAAKDAARTLSAVGSFLGNAAIWLAIMSPLWILIAIVVFFIARNERRRRGSRPVIVVPQPPPPQA